MKIYHSFEEYQPVKNPVLTVGTFDGVHFGHQKILERLKDIARQINGKTIIMTFFPHPRMILDPEDTSLKMINTIEEKAALLEKMGIDHLLIIPFTRDFSNLGYEQFIEDILVKTIGVKKLVIGYDHHFGKNRAGSFDDLKMQGPKHGFDVEEISEQDVDDVAVSSTKIRNALLQGKVSVANHYLDYPFFITGKVVKGDMLGRKFGYPTANLYIEQLYKLIPSDGIYAVRIKHKNKSYQGMLYIGNRPTINGMTHNIEVNIFDFDLDIYHQHLTVEFLQFIRPDKKFDSVDDMIVQIGKDKEDCLAFFSSEE